MKQTNHVYVSSKKQAAHISSMEQALLILLAAVELKTCR